jgi:NADH:ubiquinone oxidoreductase subunit H
MISYELALGLAFLSVIVTYGTLDLQQICRIQGGVWFGMPAKEVIAGAVFRPGRISGRAVRVRIQQPFNFSLSKGGLGN